MNPNQTISQRDRRFSLLASYRARPGWIRNGLIRSVLWLPVLWRLIPWEWYPLQGSYWTPEEGRYLVGVELGAAELSLVDGRSVRIYVNHVGVGRGSFVGLRPPARS